jgi:predicted ATP-dependent serine protease
MYLLKCVKCRAVKMHEDGKCMICGHISSVRNSIEALYPSNRNKNIAGEQTIRASRSNRSSSGFVRDVVTTSIIVGAMSDSCSSSGSDGGSSCD